MMKYIEIDEKTQDAITPILKEYIAYYSSKDDIFSLAIELRTNGRCKQEDFERFITKGNKFDPLVSFLQGLHVTVVEENKKCSSIISQVMYFWQKLKHTFGHEHNEHSPTSMANMIDFWSKISGPTRQITVFYNTNLLRLNRRGHLQVTNKFTIGVSNTDICPGETPARLYHGRSGNMYNYEGAGPTTDQDTHLVVMYDNLQLHPHYHLGHPWQEIELPLPFCLDPEVFQGSNREHLITIIRNALTGALSNPAQTPTEQLSM